MILAVYRGSTVTNRRRRIGSVQLPSSVVVYRDSPSCLRVLPWIASAVFRIGSVSSRIAAVVAVQRPS